MNSRELRILHLDPDLVAIDKPAGLLVHPSALDAHEQSSALHLLRDQLRTIGVGFQICRATARRSHRPPCGPEWEPLLRHAS